MDLKELEKRIVEIQSTNYHDIAVLNLIIQKKIESTSF